MFGCYFGEGVCFKVWELGPEFVVVVVMVIMMVVMSRYLVWRTFWKKEGRGWRRWYIPIY